MHSFQFKKICDLPTKTLKRLTVRYTQYKNELHTYWTLFDCFEFFIKKLTELQSFSYTFMLHSL